MKRYGKLIAPLAVLALLAGCGRGLPPSLQRDIRLENENVQDAERQVEKAEGALNANLAKAPDLFANAAEPLAWKTSISEARADLRAAETDARELTRLLERNRPDPHISFLLADERRLRDKALKKAHSPDEAVATWLDYKRDPAAFLAKINHEKEAVRTFDLTPASKVVHRAEQDWPAKKTVLETRLAALTNGTKVADVPPQASASVLIAEEETLSHQTNTLGTQSQQLQADCGQLYDSWDKILTDLDRPHDGPDTLYRERLKTVRTHLIDVPLKKSETHSEEHWFDISEASYHAVENDIGMAIAHKDAGLFDSEAQSTPQPPGFSYVASPAVGSNQYGYWSHSGGESVWTFLPQYLILRELLWNHDYHPVMVSEWNSYRVAQSRGTTYYGRETPTAPPKYGTHGTFTQSHYADSRYVQSGGFKGSAYASNGSPAASPGVQNRPQAGFGNESQGRRFGSQPGAAPSGQRFGRAPSPRPPGRSFGRRH